MTKQTQSTGCCAHGYAVCDLLDLKYLYDSNYVDITIDNIGLSAYRDVAHAPLDPNERRKGPLVG